MAVPTEYENKYTWHSGDVEIDIDSQDRNDAAGKVQRASDGRFGTVAGQHGVHPKVAAAHVAAAEAAAIAKRSPSALNVKAAKVAAAKAKLAEAEHGASPPVTAKPVSPSPVMEPPAVKWAREQREKATSEAAGRSTADLKRAASDAQAAAQLSNEFSQRAMSAVEMGKHEVATSHLASAEKHANAAAGHANAAEKLAATSIDARVARNAADHAKLLVEQAQGPVETASRLAARRTPEASGVALATTTVDLDSTRSAAISDIRGGLKQSAAGIAYASGGPSAEIAPQAQRELRRGMERIVDQYGLHKRDVGLAHSNEIAIRTEEYLSGGAGAYHNQRSDTPGMMEMTPNTAGWVKQHASRDAASLRELGRRSAEKDDAATAEIFSVHVMHHEAIHGYGPLLELGKHRVAIEEITTEMSARKITADMHGLPSHSTAVSEAYDWGIQPFIGHIATTTGVTRERAHLALEHASIQFKARKGEMDHDWAIHHIATDTAAHLGISDAKIVTTIGHGIRRATGDFSAG